MGKKSKLKNGGKMYDDDPGCKYIVVENPWPNWGPAASRNKRWFEHVGAWLWYATNKTFLPDEICYVSTRNEVIVKFADNLDISCLLGEHDWRKFSLKGNIPPDGYSSYIFEYNYGMKGHPDDHQWNCHPLRDLSKDAGLLRGELPVKQPYPSPVWADSRDRMRSSRELALAIPTEKPKSASSEAASSNAVAPQPPSIYSGLGGLIPDRPQQPPGAIREQAHDSSRLPPGRLYTGKLDPEDEEAAALRRLKTEPREGQVPRIKQEAGPVKSEPDHGAALVLQAEYEAWRKSREAQSVGVKQEHEQDGRSVVKREPTAEAFVKADPESANEPSEELLRLHAEYERNRLATSVSAQRESAPTDASSSSVKREPAHDGQVGRSTSRDNRTPVQVKLEHTVHGMSASGVKMEPREHYRIGHPRSHDTTASKARTSIVKRESNTDDREYVKRVKTE